ncbi:MAG: nitroreductase family deazaflavin-dependent oxidoreductase [Candidatus Binatia bacterium]
MRRETPGPLRRALFRLPLWLERVAGHGPAQAVTRLVGVDWIVLETVGRRSGRPHTVVLDIVGRDATRYYVQPAYGRRADWVCNALAEPRVHVRIGTRRCPARVRDATGAEGAGVVLRFIRAHPWYARVIVWFVGYTSRLDRSDAELLRDLAATPVLAIELVAD